MSILETIFTKLHIITSLKGILDILSTSSIAVILPVLNKIVKTLRKKNWYKELGLPYNTETRKTFSYFIPTRGQDIDPCNNEEMIDKITDCSQELIPFFIKENFKKNKNGHYIVLADSGMGKTTFLYNLSYSYYKKLFRKHKIKYLPLTINNVFKEISNIEDEQNTILLLDAIDENREAMADYKKFFNKIVETTLKFHTIIITCRTQFFPNGTEEPKYTEVFNIGTSEKKVTFEKIYISPFNDQEINTYLKKKYNRILERNKIKRAKKLIVNCPKLMVRPMLLSYIDDLIIDKTNQYEYAFQIYMKLVAKWIEREVNSQEHRDRLYQFSDKVAEHMYLKNSLFISENEITDLCAKYNIDIETIEAKSRSLLNRNINGNYKFAHKSILEYFLAAKAFNELELRKKFMENDFIGYDMVKLFLREMGINKLNEVFYMGVDNQRNVSFAYFPLENAFCFNRRLINCDFEGSNLCEAIFHMADLSKANLRGVNLERADLSGADLSGADLRETHLEGADLKEANLKIANLREADLVNTYLEGADLEKANLERADLEGADLKRANLRGTGLREANLKGVCLREANLVKAYLERANLMKTNLEGADLREADLREANLREADLREANLKGANLWGADLREADLWEADL